MKKLLSATILVLAACLFLFNAPAFAEGNPVEGAKVFGANCASCHAGGKNLVVPAKSLKIEDLTKYGKNTEEAIITQVTKGAGVMPAFAGRLKPDQIANVAAYVLSKAEAGW
ncbi:MAG: c-type cytochrome [Oscillatoria sp. SIO1A7]|nr:c-type cytochrome [Oscillatoria sp. SIO1A7]